MCRLFARHEKPARRISYENRGTGGYEGGMAIHSFAFSHWPEGVEFDSGRKEEILFRAILHVDYYADLNL